MISQGEGCREDVGGGWQHTRQTLEKSPTSKLYATWAHILSDRNVVALRGGRGTAGSNAPGAFLVFPCFYPAVRTGSSNTRFFTPPSGRGLVIPVFFWCRRGHLPQTSARSKQYLPVMLVRLALFSQNFHESWCRKLLAI